MKNNTTEPSASSLLLASAGVGLGKKNDKLINKRTINLQQQQQNVHHVNVNNTATKEEENKILNNNNKTITSKTTKVTGLIKNEKQQQQQHDNNNEISTTTANNKNNFNNKIQEQREQLKKQYIKSHTIAEVPFARYQHKISRSFHSITESCDDDGSLSDLDFQQQPSINSNNSKRRRSIKAKSEQEPIRQAHIDDILALELSDELMMAAYAVSVTKIRLALHKFGDVLERWGVRWKVMGFERVRLYADGEQRALEVGCFNNANANIEDRKKIITTLHQNHDHNSETIPKLEEQPPLITKHSYHHQTSGVRAPNHKPYITPTTSLDTSPHRLPTSPSSFYSGEGSSSLSVTMKKKKAQLNIQEKSLEKSKEEVYKIGEDEEAPIKPNTEPKIFFTATQREFILANHTVVLLKRIFDDILPMKIYKQKYEAFLVLARGLDNNKIGRVNMEENINRDCDVNHMNKPKAVEPIIIKTVESSTRGGVKTKNQQAMPTMTSTDKNNYNNPNNNNNNKLPPKPQPTNDIKKVFERYEASRAKGRFNRNSIEKNMANSHGPSEQKHEQLNKNITSTPYSYQVKKPTIFATTATQFKPQSHLQHPSSPAAKFPQSPPTLALSESQMHTTTKFSLSERCSERENYSSGGRGDGRGGDGQKEHIIERNEENNRNREKNYHRPVSSSFTEKKANNSNLTNSECKEAGDSSSHFFLKSSSSSSTLILLHTPSRKEKEVENLRQKYYKLIEEFSFFTDRFMKVIEEDTDVVVGEEDLEVGDYEGEV